MPAHTEERTHDICVTFHSVSLLLVPSYAYHHIFLTRLSLQSISTTNTVELKPASVTGVVSVAVFIDLFFWGGKRTSHVSKCRRNTTKNSTIHNKSTHIKTYQNVSKTRLVPQKIVTLTKVTASFHCLVFSLSLYFCISSSLPVRLYSSTALHPLPLTTPCTYEYDACRY